MALEFTVNYVSVLIAAAASFSLGMAWYGPLFGKQWMKDMKMSKKDLEKAKKETNMSLVLGQGFIVSLITAFVLAISLNAFQAGSDLLLAFQASFWLWLGFMATIYYNGVLWSKKSWNGFMIDAGYSLSSLLVASVVLVYL